MEMQEIINGGHDLLKATQVPDGNGYQLVVVFFTHKGRDYRYCIRREFTHNLGSYIQCASISEREKMYGWYGCKRQVKNYLDVSKFEDAVKRIQKMYDAYHNNEAQMKTYEEILELILEHPYINVSIDEDKRIVITFDYEEGEDVLECVDGKYDCTELIKYMYI